LPFISVCTEEIEGIFRTETAAPSIGPPLLEETFPLILKPNRAEAVKAMPAKTNGNNRILPITSPLKYGFSLGPYTKENNTFLFINVDVKNRFTT
jgi:hypothetical protein